MIEIKWRKGMRRGRIKGWHDHRVGRIKGRGLKPGEGRKGRGEKWKGYFDYILLTSSQKFKELVCMYVRFD